MIFSQQLLKFFALYQFHIYSPILIYCLESFFITFSMQRSYKSLIFQREGNQFNITFQQDKLTILIRTQRNLTLETIIYQNNLSDHLKFSFNNLENIYQFFQSASSETQNNEYNIMVKDNTLILKIRQNISGIDIIKEAQVQLFIQEHLPNSEQKLINIPTLLKTEQLVHFPVAEVSPKRMKEDAINLISKCDDISQKMILFEQQLQYIKESINLNEFKNKLNAFQKKQEFLISKISNNEEKMLKMSNEKKEVKKMFETSIEEVCNQIQLLKQTINNIPSLQLVSRQQMEKTMSKEKYRIFQNSSHDAFKKKDIEGEIEQTDKPIPFIRNSGNLQGMVEESMNPLRRRHSSITLTGDEPEKEKMGFDDINLFKKKIRDIERTLQNYIPPKQIKISFTNSPYNNKFKMEYKNLDCLTVTKIAVDKKYQLIGEALPEAGKCYFRLKLISVPHGYLHFGIVNTSNELEQSSYMSQNSINYFGGNGSLNDKGNGIFIGKQLQNLDVITIMVDNDFRKIKFIRNDQVLAEADLNGMDRSKQLLPYFELFYGGSKIDIINY